MNDHTPSSDPAIRVHELLRRAREQQGLRLEEVETKLRIRRPYLEAIEAGQYDKLPANAYALGFVRSYAQLLGFDRSDMVERFKQERGTQNLEPVLLPPRPIPEGKLPSAPILIGAAVVAVLVPVLWALLAGPDPEAAPAASAPPAASVVNLAAVNPTPVVGLAATSPLAQAVTQAEPAATAPAPAPTVPPAREPAANADSGSGTALPTASAPTQPPRLATPAAPAPRAAPAIASRFTLRATADSWVLLRNADGVIVFSRLLRAGDSYAIPEQPGLSLTTGNAGGLVVLDKGRPLAPLGASNVVVRDLRLDNLGAGARGQPAGR